MHDTRFLLYNYIRIYSESCKIHQKWSKACLNILSSRHCPAISLVFFKKRIKWIAQIGKKLLVFYWRSLIYHKIVNIEKSSFENNLKRINRRYIHETRYVEVFFKHFSTVYSTIWEVVILDTTFFVYNYKEIHSISCNNHQKNRKSFLNIPLSKPSPSTHLVFFSEGIKLNA